MKTDEELLALKQEYETLNNKLAELTAGELIKVTGGTVERIGSAQRPQGYERALYGVNYEYAIFSPLSRSKLHVIVIGYNRIDKGMIYYDVKYYRYYFTERINSPFKYTILSERQITNRYSDLTADLVL